MKSILLLALLLVTGCGTMLSGTKEEITIKSTPPGVTIHVDGKEMTTPATVVLARKTEHYVTFPGGQRVKIGKTFWGNGEHYLNILWLGAGILPGFVAIVIDLVTGGQENLEPDHLEYKDGRVYNKETGKIVPWEK